MTGTTRAAECDPDHATVTVRRGVVLISNFDRPTARRRSETPLLSDSRSVNVTTTHVNEAVPEALFASALQPSDTLTAEMIADAIGSSIRRLGAAGCACRVAQEFGDHPEEAADRMRWIQQLLSDFCGCLYFSTTAPAATASAATDLLPLSEAA
jgi:hypothetical protein